MSAKPLPKEATSQDLPTSKRVKTDLLKKIPRETPEESSKRTYVAKLRAKHESQHPKPKEPQPATDPSTAILLALYARAAANKSRPNPISDDEQKKSTTPATDWFPSGDRQGEPSYQEMKATFENLLLDTKTYQQKYKNKFRIQYYFDQKRLAMTGLIETLSKMMSTILEKLSPSETNYSYLQNDYHALKGLLVLNALVIEKEDQAKKNAWVPGLYRPINNTAMYPMLLASLQVTKLSEIWQPEKLFYLEKLEQYLDNAIASKQIEKTPYVETVLNQVKEHKALLIEKDTLAAQTPSSVA